MRSTLLRSGASAMLTCCTRPKAGRRGRRCRRRKPRKQRCWPAPLLGTARRLQALFANMHLNADRLAALCRALKRKVGGELTVSVLELSCQGCAASCAQTMCKAWGVAADLTDRWGCPARARRHSEQLLQVVRGREGRLHRQGLRRACVHSGPAVPGGHHRRDAGGGGGSGVSHVAPRV